MHSPREPHARGTPPGKPGSDTEKELTVSPDGTPFQAPSARVRLSGVSNQRSTGQVSGVSLAPM
ncbi:hypothetical protein DFO74_105137 [Chromohalobacter israelensis]|nr:hypothetical protein DFO74_105137 [Chromohalobacter salexigens]